MLVVCAQYTRSFSYFDDWQEALCRSPEISARVLNLCDGDGVKNLRPRIKDFDGVILLHSAMGDDLRFIEPLMGALARRRGKLMSFVGNEVNLPGASIRHKLEMLKRLGPEFIATQLSLSAGRYLYEDLRNTRVVAIPHALNPSRFRIEVPQRDRSVDVGIRSFRYLPCLGDEERNRIMDFFALHEFDPALKTDINTDPGARLTPDQWAAFLNQCKGTASTEAGSYYLEKDDRTVLAIQDFINKQGGWRQRAYEAIRRSPVRKLLPARARRGIRAGFAQTRAEMRYRAHREVRDEEVGFEVIYDRFFRDYPRPVSGKCISSRHFDAIGAGTCQIMFPGEFNGVLQANVHYLALRRDFSNIGEVMEKFGDVAFRERMTHETREYVLEHHTYRHRTQEIVRLFRSG